MHVWALGLSCEALRLRGRRGFTRQPENSKRAHFRVPALQTPPKFHEKDPQEKEERMNCGGRGKKERNFGRSGGGRSGGGWSGGGWSGRGAVPPPFGPHSSGPNFSGFGGSTLRGPTLAGPTLSCIFFILFFCFSFFSKKKKKEAIRLKHKFWPSRSTHQNTKIGQSRFGPSRPPKFWPKSVN